MSTFQSIHYERVMSEDDEEEEMSDMPPPTFVTTRGPEKHSRWNHIENLDDFFIRLYKYYRAQGFLCLLLTDVFILLQYVFIVLFATFLVFCINYEILFKDPYPTFHKVVEFANFNVLPPGMGVCLFVAFSFWTIRLLQVLYNIYRAWGLKQFFREVLCVNDSDLINMKWTDIKQKLIEAQKVHQMCIHKKDLSELDIHHRILRRKNYMIALQNKGVLDCLYQFPLFGKKSFLTEGVKFNLYLILFRGPGAPFENSWKLKPEYKDINSREYLANELSKRIFLLGVLNFLFCPFILIYQILYSFFTYAELVKRSPDLFGARKWSLYGRLYLRHFNELDHEFQQRLSKAYDPSKKYMNSFMSPILTIIAKNIAFFAGAILAVMLGLSFYDQDVLTAEYVISFMATLGIIIKICTGCMPDENIIYCPEVLMAQILSVMHYIPNQWKGKSHTLSVREEFSRIFQYKFVYLIEELLSPLLTPFILCFSIRHKSQQIIDFYRNFSVEVTGVGDVCSFAQMDLRKHGYKKWSNDAVEDDVIDVEKQAENGKTELSLLHFSYKNPTWRPSHSGQQQFIDTIREHALNESLSLSAQNALHRQNSTQYLMSQGFPSSIPNDHTTFLGGLQSFGYPSMDARNLGASQVSPEQQDMLMNASMMYAANAHGFRTWNDHRQQPTSMYRTCHSDDSVQVSHRTWPEPEQPLINSATTEKETPKQNEQDTQV